MKSREIEKIIKRNSERIKSLKKYEKTFSAHKYDGKGKRQIEYINGNSAIAIAASHSVNFFEDGNKKAEAFSGGLTQLLAREAGCHALYIEKSYSDVQRGSIVSQVGNYIVDNKLKVVIELQIVEKAVPNEEPVIFLSSTNHDDEKYGFLCRAIQYSFHYKYRNKGMNRVVELSVNTPKSVMKAAADEKRIAYVYLGINKAYVNPEKIDEFSAFYDALVDTVKMLSNLEWDAERIRVYKLWSSMDHKPQDKIEIVFKDEADTFCDEIFLNICTYGLKLEKVRLRTPNKRTKNDLKKHIENTEEEKEYIFLTNRLIENLFGREWIEAGENEPGLREAPVIVYLNERESYPIGMPKADQIDGVFFSTALFETKKQESELFDYVVFNRYTDSRLHIEYEKVNYADFGRVQADDGTWAERIMIPRYYRRLLGYLDYPLKRIREEEYDKIIKKLAKDERAAFRACYKKIDGEAFYGVRKKFTCDEEDKNSREDMEIKKKVIDVQKRLGLYSSVELLKSPKEVKQKEKIIRRLQNQIDKLKIAILKKAIGKSEYFLKTEWTGETDDKNNIARLSANMMSLLGITENDKILVRFGKKQEILRALVNEELEDYQIGIPAPVRKNLGMNSVNDIVSVHRDMVHIFWRHSEEQTIAILGTILAVFQVITEIWAGVLLCIIVIPLIMYFVLNQERVKVK